MRYDAEHKQKTRAVILDAAGRVFRSEGYGGSGIDALTKRAGVTNGAFYGHFKTKAEAFRTVVLLGLRELREAIEYVRAARGDDWLTPFVAVYLGEKVDCDIGEACALAMLSAEVARSDVEARRIYEDEFRAVVAAMAAGLGGDSGRAMAILVLLMGAATSARAVLDPALRSRIIGAAREAVATLAAADPSAVPHA